MKLSFSILLLIDSCIIVQFISYTYLTDSQRLDWWSRDSKRMGLSIEHELINPIMFHLPYIVLFPILVLYLLPITIATFEINRPRVNSTRNETHRRMYQIRILHDLRKQETLLEVIEASSTHHINIIDSREATAGATGCVDGDKSIPSPVTVRLVSGSAVCIVIALDNLWSKNIIRGGDPKAGCIVKSFRGGWRLGVKSGVRWGVG